MYASLRFPGKVLESLTQIGLFLSPSFHPELSGGSCLSDCGSHPLSYDEERVSREAVRNYAFDDVMGPHVIGVCYLQRYWGSSAHRQRPTASLCDRLRILVEHVVNNKCVAMTVGLSLKIRGVKEVFTRDSPEQCFRGCVVD